VPALIAAAAKASVVGPKGRREIAVEDVMLAPRQLALTKGEIIASFILPPQAKGSADAYLRFIPRTEMDIAVVGCGVCLTVDDKGVVSRARVALGAVAARPLLVEEAAKALLGSKVDDAALRKLDAAAGAACKPIDDKRGTKEYRIKVAGVLARRAAQIAFERARKA
jgi:aerobic carbon-monoxide dehydrogenase medium subunit